MDIVDKGERFGLPGNGQFFCRPNSSIITIVTELPGSLTPCVATKRHSLTNRIRKDKQIAELTGGRMNVNCFL